MKYIYSIGKYLDRLKIPLATDYWRFSWPFFFFRILQGCHLLQANEKNNENVLHIQNTFKFTWLPVFLRFFFFFFFSRLHLEKSMPGYLNQTQTVASHVFNFNWKFSLLNNPTCLENILIKQSPFSKFSLKILSTHSMQLICNMFQSISIVQNEKQVFVFQKSNVQAKKISMHDDRFLNEDSSEGEVRINWRNF